MHTVQDGAANRSYGIQVAALAGVPRTVINQARAKLHELENRDHSAPESRANNAPSATMLLPVIEENELYDALDMLDPDQLSPRDALDWLYKLKALSAKLH